MNKYNENNEDLQTVISNNSLIHNECLSQGYTGIQCDTQQINTNIVISESTTTSNDDDDINVKDLDLSNVPRLNSEPKAYTGNGVLSHFRQVHYRSENQWSACCPAHNDGTPSLGIKHDPKTGLWLFNCFAGCSYDEIVLAANLTREDLGQKPFKRGSTIEAIYKYVDENGNYLFESQKLRKKDGSKTFVQKAGKSKDIKGIRRVLYGLPDVINAAKEKGVIFICEGEKDCESFNSMTNKNFIATTNPGGASKWAHEYSKALKSYGVRLVIIIHDNDDAGKKHCLQVAESLSLQDIKVELVSIPKVKDISEWVAARIDELIAQYPNQGIPRDFANQYLREQFKEILKTKTPFEFDENNAKYSRLVAESSTNKSWKSDETVTGYIENCYYNQRSKLYYIPKDNGWIEVTRVDARFALGARGIPVRLDPERIDQNISDVDVALNSIVSNNAVVYSGPIAGYFAGVLTNCGKRILVTTSPEYPTPVQGEHSTIDNIIMGMLGAEQKLIFECSLKLHIQQLYKGIPHQQQVLCFIGDAGSGKSVLQNLIVTPLLGKRVARAYKFFSGQDNYNSQIIESEHLLIEDDSPAFDARSRNTLTVNLTGIAVNDVTSVRAMYCAAVNLSAIQLVTLSANSENVNTLPYLNDSSRDKLMLFKCNKTTMPMPTGSPEERKIFADKIQSEINAYTYYLLNELVVPKEMYGERYGVNTYHNPEIIAIMQEQSIEGEFQLMLEDCLFSDESLNWSGTNVELFNLLCTDSRFQRRAEKMLPNTRRVSLLLSSLSKQSPENYKQRHTRGGNVWDIKSINNIKLDSDIDKIGVKNMDLY